MELLQRNVKLSVDNIAWKIIWWIIDNNMLFYKLMMHCSDKLLQTNLKILFYTCDFAAF